MAKYYKVYIKNTDKCVFKGAFENKKVCEEFLKRKIKENKELIKLKEEHIDGLSNCILDSYTKSSLMMDVLELSNICEENEYLYLTD